MIGTSALVSPACDLPVIAKKHGAIIVEVNIEETQLTRLISDWILKGPASEILCRLVEEMSDAGQADTRRASEKIGFFSQIS